MVLTYEYRGLADLALLERDMQAAFTFVQKEGATTIASVGASIGALGTTKLRIELPTARKERTILS